MVAIAMNPMKTIFLPCDDKGFEGFTPTIGTSPHWETPNHGPGLVPGPWKNGDFGSFAPDLQSPSEWCDESTGFKFVPTLHPAPFWTDGPSWGAGDKDRRKRKPKLTRPEDGIRSRSQTIFLNLSEIAHQLVEEQKFCRVGKGLGVYLSPHWQLISGKEAAQEVICNLLDDDTAQFISTQQLAEIVSKIRISPKIPHYKEIPEIDPHLLACQDGFFQWPEGNTFPPSSNIVRFNYLDVSMCEIGPGETPYFDIFLNNMAAGNTDVIQRLLEVIGVILTGYPAKSFFLFEGETNTGKSQLAKFLKNLLGKSSCFAVNDVNDLGGQWTMGMLPGKLLCLCSDVPDIPLSSKAVGLIKQLTGDDPINGPIKYKGDIIFDNTAKLLFLSNFPLQISGGKEDIALIDRLICVPFRNSVPANQRIPDLHKKLKQEAGAIIWKAIQALMDYEARGERFTPLEEDSSSEKEIQLIPSERDLLLQFVDEACVLEAGASITADELCSEYNWFRQQQGFVATPIQSSSFGKRLMGLGLPIKRYATSAQRGYRGIRLCHPDEKLLSL